jgi:Zn-dependent alcohol dehydrogenase
MKAAVLHAPRQPMTIEQVAIEKPRRREVLVRTAAAGLCHSDLHFIEGSYPTPVPVVLGHEAAGIVEAVGEDVTYVRPGDRVISCLFLRERRIQGSMMGSNRFRTDMPRLIEFYLQGRLKLDEMVSARIPLERINDGFDALQRGGIARSVIVFDH